MGYGSFTTPAAWLLTWTFWTTCDRALCSCARSSQCRWSQALSTRAQCSQCSSCACEQELLHRHQCTCTCAGTKTVYAKVKAGGADIQLAGCHLPADSRYTGEQSELRQERLAEVCRPCADVDAERASEALAVSPYRVHSSCTGLQCAARQLSAACSSWATSTPSLLMVKFTGQPAGAPCLKPTIMTGGCVAC